MTLALFECLNPDCSMVKPYGWCEEMPALDASADPTGAQTDWPICDHCLEPLTLADVVPLDEERLVGFAQEAFEHYHITALRRLRAICAGMIFEARQKGGEAA